MKVLILTAALLSLVVSGTLVEMMRGLNKQAYDWVGVPDDKFEEALKQSQLNQYSKEISLLIARLENMNVNMTIKSLEEASKVLTANPGLVEAIKKYLAYAWTPIEFLEEKKKLKHLRSFSADFPKYSENIFDKRNEPETRGKRLGIFIKGFLQWYYVTIISESSTLSTVLMRALTSHTPVLSHKDLSFCIDIESVGQLCQQLQNMDINSVFLKVPAIFDTIRHLKLKPKCQNDQNRQLLRNLTSRIQNIDMFRYMYENYEPYVDIATQKYGLTKVKMLARNFAAMIDNSTDIEHDQKTRPSELTSKHNNDIKDISEPAPTNNALEL